MVPRGLRVPEGLRGAQVKVRKREQKCWKCGKLERRYVCPRTKKVSCSFDCYKLIHHQNQKGGAGKRKL
jgi:hypothetical protein